MKTHSLKSRYEQAKKDHDYLWQTYGPAYDMTGGYVDSEDLKKMLARPTKWQATECLESQIAYWFEVGSESWQGRLTNPDWRNDPVVQEIAERRMLSVP